MVPRQCVLAMELENIGREKFDGSLAKRQIRQYFPPSINLRYKVFIYLHRLELLKVLTENGKKVDYIEEIIGPFLLKWMPEVHMTKKYVFLYVCLSVFVSFLPLSLSEYQSMFLC